jgi:putative aldouronate transport system substrate-binding protein
MNVALKKGIAVAAAIACLAGAAFGQGRMKITLANYQIEPTEPNGESLKIYGDKLGVDFAPVNIDNNRYHEILNIKLAAGEIPDFFYLKQADTLGNYVKQGVLAKIPMDLAKKYAPNMLKVLQDYAPGYLEMGVVKGAQYGIPAVNATNVFHIPLVYRSDWMKKVGVTKVPETFAEFESLMYKFARNDPDGNGKNDTYGLSQDGLNAIFGAFGQVPFDHNSKGAAGTDYWMVQKGKVVNSMITPETKATLIIMAKWYKDGIIDPEFIAADPKATLVLGPALKGPTGAQGIKCYNMLMNFYVIGKQVEKDQAKMIKILQMMEENANPDYVARTEISSGAVNKYWKVLDLESESFINIPPYDKDVGYSSRIGGKLLNVVLPFPPKAFREQWAYSMDYDKLGITSAIQVGLPIAIKYKTDLMKMRDEAYIAIITGAKGVDYFDEFARNYLAAGGADAQKEANDYYEEMTGN